MKPLNSLQVKCEQHEVYIHMQIKLITTKDERQAAYHVRKAVFVHEQNVPEELEIDEFEEDAIHFICYEKDESVGASRLRLLGEYGKLERIAVKKAFRGNSIGRKIIQRMEEEIISHHIKTAKLNAQTHATGFYEKLGYEISSGEFMDAGIPHVTMIKKLHNHD